MGDGVKPIETLSLLGEEANVIKATSHCCRLPNTPSPDLTLQLQMHHSCSRGWLPPWRNKPLLCYIFHVSSPWINPCVRSHSITIPKPYQLLRETFAMDDGSGFSSFSTWAPSRTATRGLSHVCALVYTLPLLLKHRERTQHYHSCRGNIEYIILLSFYIIFQAHIKVISQELLCLIFTVSLAIFRIIWETQLQSIWNSVFREI